MSLPTNFFIGRGGASVIPAITGNDLTNVQTYTGTNGTVYYKSTSTTTSKIGVVGGGTLFVAMVGAGGAGGRQGYGGSGGLGIAKIKLPSVDAAGNALTRLFFLRGRRGTWTSNNTGAVGGAEQGGNAGSYDGGSGNHYTNDLGGSGGGIVGIQAGQSSGSRELVHSGNNLHLAYVGSGGGGAHQETNNRGAGNGGGINRDGHFVPYGALGATYAAQGGTLTAGGAAASQPSYNPQGTGTDGFALGGGRGHDTSYDGSGGGGAGWFGGGGGKGGGGYDGGGGGGGSGYAHPTATTVLYAAEQDSNPGQSLTTNLAIHSNDTATFFENTVGIAASAGNGGSVQTDGGHGEIIVWNGL